MEQKAGKKTVKMGLVPNALGKGPRERDEIIPSEAVHPLTLLSIPASETKECCDDGYGDAGWDLKRLLCQKGARQGQPQRPGCTDRDSATSPRGCHPQEMLPPSQG